MLEYPLDAGQSVQLAQLAIPQSAQGPAPALPEGAIGHVSEASGSVGVRRGGAEVALAEGDPVFLGDGLTTGGDGAVTITFVDGTVFSLGAGGGLVLDSLVYNPGGGGNDLSLSLLRGAFAFLTGEIAKAPGDGMEITTTLGTIGVRGTAVTGSLFDQLRVALIPDLDSTPDFIQVTNAVGSITLDSFYDLLTVTGANSPFPALQQLSEAQIEQVFSAVLGALRTGIEQRIQREQEQELEQQQQEEQQQEAPDGEEAPNGVEGGSLNGGANEGHRSDFAPSHPGPPPGQLPFVNGLKPEIVAESIRALRSLIKPPPGRPNQHPPDPNFLNGFPPKGPEGMGLAFMLVDRTPNIIPIYLQGSSERVVNPDFQIGDDGDSVVRAVVAIVGGTYVVGEDSLTFNGSGNYAGPAINANFDSGTGILTLTAASPGTVSSPDFADALSTVAYFNSAPSTADLTPRQIRFLVDDGSDHSNPVTIIVQIDPTSDGEVTFDGTGAPQKQFWVEDGATFNGHSGGALDPDHVLVGQGNKIFDVDDANSLLFLAGNNGDSLRITGSFGTTGLSGFPFFFEGGNGNDSVDAGGLLTDNGVGMEGGGGNDHFTLGAGDDIVYFTLLEQSGFDTVDGFDTAGDEIDLRDVFDYGPIGLTPADLDSTQAMADGWQVSDNGSDVNVVFGDNNGTGGNSGSLGGLVIHGIGDGSIDTFVELDMAIQLSLTA